LESWNDFNPKKTHYSLSQPTISPLFKTRQAQETLLKWSGNTADYHSYIQKVWQEQVFPMQGKYMTFTEFWNSSLHDGAIEVGKGSEILMPSGKMEADTAKAEMPIVAEAEVKEEASAQASTVKIDLGDAARKINAVKSGAVELALYQKNAIGNGALANNPLLQEMPDPISKITWDNYITMSPIDMNGTYNLMERQDREASIANVTVNGITVQLPVIPQPGQASGTIGIAVGYGREKAGSLSEKCGVVGKNVYPFVQFANGTFQYEITDVQISPAGETIEMAGTQIHHTIMGRDLVRETTLAEYAKNPKSGNHDHTVVTHSGVKKAKDIDLWDEHEKIGHKWGLAIDLNSCYGCGACVVSCSVENNVAVVGRDQVMKTREMHWLRIDRYYTSDMTKQKAETDHVGKIDMYLQMENPAAANPKVVFQPMMCQHCNHAPCETVCPVLATNHSSDGLNMMTYNRCVGTRYCANNCPFKVRRFNWFNYNENPDFAFNPSQDDLGRMVLNPDVVVRSRGVMEKCSMCVQRIQAGKLEAKKAERVLQDSDITVACAEACPTNAIVFGDVNDETSTISKFVKEQEARNYYLLEEFGVRPNVSYLTKVRNSDSSFSDGDHESHKAHATHEGEEHKAEEHTHG
jgi:Fe-S-cluster-containing dehydrogenase component